MNTTHSDALQAPTQDVVYGAFRWTPEPYIRPDGSPAVRFKAEAEGEWVRYDDVRMGAEAHASRATAWRPMSSAPVGDPRACIDIWCGQDECRRTDCFWHEDRWCYEVFEDKYRVVPVKNPVAWMPTPAKPEGV